MLVSDKSGTDIGLCLTDCIACRITRLRASYLPVPASQLRVTHVGLAWDSSPVASQHSYGGLTSGLPVSSLLWLGSESYFICNELWSAIQSVPKSKNPINHSVVLALGESNNGRLNGIKSSPVVRQDHTEIYGVLYSVHRLMPLRRFGLYTVLSCVKKFFQIN